MLNITRRTHPLIEIINNSLIDLPAATNLSHWWNYGSLLGICLVIQILTGLFLSINIIIFDYAIIIEWIIFTISSCNIYITLIFDFIYNQNSNNHVWY